MLISVRKRFVFVANTKAASTSIEGALGPHAEIARPGGPQGKHIPLGKARYEYRFLFDSPDHPFASFFKFGVMREPLDWIGSWFRYRKGNKVDAPLPAGMTFAQFWEQGDWNIRRSDGRPFLQRDMFCDQRGAVLADLILPYDRLDELLPAVFAGLGIAASLPRLNVSKLRDPGEIPAGVAEQLRAHYAEDYALYDSLDGRLEAGLAALRARAV